MTPVNQTQAVLKDLRKNPAAEPAVTTGAWLSGFLGILTLITQLLPNLMSERTVGLIAVIVAILAPIVTAVFIRRKVWAPESVLEVLEEAVVEGKKALPKKPNLDTL